MSIIRADEPDLQEALYSRDAPYSSYLSVFITLALFILAIIPGPWLDCKKQQGKSGFINCETAARRLLTSGITLRETKDLLCPYEGFNSAGIVVWKGVLGHHLPFPKDGYAGPIEMLIGIEMPEGERRKARVSGVAILRHQETSNFVRGIEEEWFLRQFIGKTSADPLRAFEDLDGITQATISVEAICHSVRSALQLVSAQQIVENPASMSSAFNKSMVAIMLAIMLILFERKIPRWMVSIGVCALLGFYSQQYLSLIHVALIRNQFATGRLVASSFLILFVVAIVFSLFYPRGYCRKLCPMGRLQGLLWEGHARLGERNKISFEQHWSLGRLLLWGGLTASIAGSPSTVESFEIFSTVFLNRGESWGIFEWAQVLGIAGGSIILPHFYCRLLCPLRPLFIELERLRSR